MSCFVTVRCCTFKDISALSTLMLLKSMINLPKKPLDQNTFNAVSSKLVTFILKNWIWSCVYFSETCNTDCRVMFNRVGLTISYLKEPVDFYVVVFLVNTLLHYDTCVKVAVLTQFVLKGNPSRSVSAWWRSYACIFIIFLFWNTSKTDTRKIIYMYN